MFSTAAEASSTHQREEGSMTTAMMAAALSIHCRGDLELVDHGLVGDDDKIPGLFVVPGGREPGGVHKSFQIGTGDLFSCVLRTLLLVRIASSVSMRAISFRQRECIIITISPKSITGNKKTPWSNEPPKVSLNENPRRR